MQKLVVAKKIMDAHNKTPRAGNNGGMPSTPMLEQFNAPPAMYNIPQEYMSEQTQVQPQQHQSQLPVKDKILNSRLPDEIKRLMIEHPIDQPNTMAGPTLSNDLIEAAARLMKTDAAGGTPQQNQQRTQQPQYQTPNMSGGIDYSLLKSIIRDTITEVLTEKGLVAESSSKTKEQISFRVGQHVFEGFVTKIKKMK